jgi:hypothetical protein
VAAGLGRLHQSARRVDRALAREDEDSHRGGGLGSPARSAGRGMVGEASPLSRRTPR